MREVISDFLDYLTVEKGASTNTHDSYHRDLEEFLIYCKIHKLSSIRVSTLDLRRYLAHLKKRGLSSSSVARKLSSVRQLYRFLLREKWTDEDATELVTVTVKGRKLPHVISHEEMKLIIESAKGLTDFEVRDRAILEVWYATGGRITELCSLKFSGVDLIEGMVKLFGKGRRERLVPIHAEALKWCKKYSDIRHNWLQKIGLMDSPQFFINRQGQHFSRQGLWKILKKYVLKSGLSKKVWPHLIRHSFATHLLQGGADLRVVQELLGHRSIRSTQVYTHLDIENLKVMSLKYHPRG